MTQKILFVCSQGRHRSRTAAIHLRRRLPDIDTAFAGTSADADVPLTAQHVAWADTIICMEHAHRSKIRRRWKRLSSKIRVWSIPDEHSYGDLALVALIEDRMGLLPESAVISSMNHR